MSTLALLPVQAAIYSKLTADGVLMGLVTGIYDTVPAHTAMPYVVIGEGESETQDLLTSTDTQCRLEISVWGEPTGRKNTLTIMDRIYGLLQHATLTISDFSLITMRCDAARTELIEEGPAIKGTLALLLLVRPN